MDLPGGALLKPLAKWLLRTPARLRLRARVAFRRVPRVVVWGEVLVGERVSGIGHYALGLVRGLDALAGEGRITLAVVLPAGTAAQFASYGLRHVDSVSENPYHSDDALGLWKEDRWRFVDEVFGAGHYLFPAFVAYPALGSPSVTVMHDVSWRSVPGTMPPEQRDYLDLHVPRALAASRALVANSAFTRDELGRWFGVPAGRVTVAHPAIDRERFRPRPAAEVAGVRERYGLPDGAYVLSVGNLEPRKNHVAVVRAMRLLADGRTLVLAGAGGWRNEELRGEIAAATASGTPVVVLENRVTDDDLPALYSGADAFAYPSLYEGFGMPVLEALACGTPVVAARNSAIPEAGGACAVYVEATDAEALAAALRDAAAPEAEALERHLAGFSWVGSATRVVEALTGRVLR